MKWNGDTFFVKVSLGRKLMGSMTNCLGKLTTYDLKIKIDITALQYGWLNKDVACEI